jgi:hypothetical protein
MDLPKDINDGSGVFMLKTSESLPPNEAFTLGSDR